MIKWLRHQTWCHFIFYILITFFFCILICYLFSPFERAYIEDQTKKIFMEIKRRDRVEILNFIFSADSKGNMKYKYRGVKFFNKFNLTLQKFRFRSGIWWNSQKQIMSTGIARIISLTFTT